MRFLPRYILKHCHFMTLTSISQSDDFISFYSTQAFSSMFDKLWPIIIKSGFTSAFTGTQTLQYHSLTLTYISRSYDYVIFCVNPSSIYV